MSKKNNTLVTAPDDVAVQAAKSTQIVGAQVVRLGRGDGHSPPCLSYNGTVPDVGKEISFTLENGVTYCGIVADAVEADGNVFVEFVNGITPVPQK